jgi:two-component system, NarL family, invasion response regulator UvrY
MTMPSNTKIKVALADDHELIRKGISDLLVKHGIDVTADANNGHELILEIEKDLPDIVLMDINMPILDGPQTTEVISVRFPNIKVIALSVFDDDANVIRMLRAGARGYLLKNSSISELLKAIEDVHRTGYHFSDLVSSSMLQNLNEDKHQLEGQIKLKEREAEFLKLCCTEMTYKEIGNAMFVSPRTAEGYGKILCEKYGLKSRVGLVLFALKHKLITIDE